MKTKILLSGLVAAAAMAFTSCADDFLEQKNTTNPNQETFFSSDKSIEEAMYPLYNYVWYGFNDKFYYSMGDGRANNITAQYSNYIKYYTNFNETSLSEGLNEAWASLYSVVAQSNNTINNISDFSGSGVSEEAKTKGIAEARFMRGVAYWYIASLWGDAIVYTRTQDLINNYEVQANPRADVMEFAIRDLEYAAAHLPETSVSGRVNKYSAYGMLSRVYLSMAGLTTEGQYDGKNVATDFNRGTRNPYYLDLAKKAALKVIKESSFSLMANYGDLFKYENNNNPESVFALQWNIGATDAIGWGANQSMPSYYAWSSMVEPGQGWGGATYCSYDLFMEYEELPKPLTDNDGNLQTVDLRKHESVAWYGQKYKDLNKKGGGYEYGVTEAAKTQGASIKKYVIGTHDDNGIAYSMSFGINTYMMRLAEVYLNFAEATMGNNQSTSDATALYYFNLVRQRGGLDPKTSISYEDLRHERRVEFAFEGLYWYDLVRRSYYKQQEVLNYINNQNRNASYYSSATHEYKLSDDYVAPGNGVATATERNLTLPYSDVDQNVNKWLKTDGSGKLTTTPYVFGDREVSEDDLFN